ncbi:MAG: Swt1 family HEPN domain-containing protein [Acidobacteriota bacterium]
MNRFRSIADGIKVFGMTNQLIETDLDQVEATLQIDLGRGLRSAAEADAQYYPQFDEKIRSEAAAMSRHYEIFYCLEKSIRTLIEESLEAVEGDKWWDSGRIPQKVGDAVRDRMQREKDAGVTLRSDEPIDFTTFGELGEIIKSNWPIFGAIFNSPKAVEKVMASLNMLRGPIAHCSPLAEDEVLRLQLSMRDWFRLME